MSTSEPRPHTSRPALGQLSVIAPGARIKVLDAFLRPVEGASGMDRLTASLVPGAYRVTARIGAREVSEAVLIRAKGKPRELFLQPRFDAAAPVDGSGTANETHGELAQDLTTGGPPGIGRLVVILRGLRNRPMAPLAAVRPIIRDAGGRTLNLPVPAEDPYHVRFPEKENRALGWAVDVEPGGCRVRWPDVGTGKEVEHALWIAPGLQTLIFVPQGPTGPVPAAASLHLLPIGSGWEHWSQANLEVEVALAVLRANSIRRRIETWQKALADPSAPPMLTLLTLHDMARALGADPTAWAALLPDALNAYAELRSTMGESPDVVALSFLSTLAEPKAPRPPETPVVPVTWPPMLRASNDLLVAAEREGRDLIAAGSLAEKVTGQMFASAPWHVYDPAGLDEAVVLPAPSGPFQGSHPFDSGVGDTLQAGSWGEPEGNADVVEPYDAATSSPPPPVALERVRDLQSMAASAPGGPTSMDAAGVAERLGMTRALAQSCMDSIAGPEKSRPDPA